MNFKRLSLFVLFLLFVVPCWGGNGQTRHAEPAPLLTELEKEEISAGTYFQLLDGEGQVITATGHRLRRGDQYLDEKNRLFTVERVEGYLAHARYIRTEKLKKPTIKKAGGPPGGKGAVANINNFAASGKPRRIIAIYHTHNDECYVPSDGTESIYGRGGIHAVGKAFKEALEEKNIHVVYSEDLHLPHDRDAYLRARGTAVELLERDPDAIFDIHRDAAPPETYAAKVDGDRVTKIQFVVGQENPYFAVNRSFAYDLKAMADAIYPGLIKGVLMGWGDFNQDLTPLNLLLEVGTHLNSKEEAESGITYFADVVSHYFYGEAVGGKEEAGLSPRMKKWRGAVLGTIAAIISLVALLLTGFYFLNNPSAWDRLKKNLQTYLGREGLVWKEGRKNLRLLAKDMTSLARAALTFLLILGQLFLVVFRGIKNRLKS